MNPSLFWVKLHPASVHFPIALFLLASVCGLLYLFWRRLPVLVTLTWPPMLLGFIGLIIAIGSGLISQSGLPPQAAYQSTLNWHIASGLGQLVCYGALLYQRWRYPLLTKKRARRIGREGEKGGKGDRETGRPGAGKSTDTQLATQQAELLDDLTARWWLMLLLIVGALLVIASGWNGGRLVFEWGVNVKV